VDDPENVIASTLTEEEFKKAVEEKELQAAFKKADMHKF
jgi:hypothetical protein